MKKEKFVDSALLQQHKESFGEKYDKIYKNIGKINMLQKEVTDGFCELGMVAAQQKNIEAEKSTDNTAMPKFPELEEIYKHVLAKKGSLNNDDTVLILHVLEFIASKLSA